MRTMFKETKKSSGPCLRSLPEESFHLLLGREEGEEVHHQQEEFLMNLVAQLLLELQLDEVLMPAFGPMMMKEVEKAEQIRIKKLKLLIDKKKNSIKEVERQKKLVLQQVDEVEVGCPLALLHPLHLFINYISREEQEPHLS